MTQQQHTLTTLDESAVQEFAAQLHGELIQPGDAAYDEARKVWNGMIDRHPALIVRCTTTADVVAAVNFAREQGLALAVRGGGHNVAGHATNDDGLVIDLSPMNYVDVDPVARTAHVGGGATLKVLDAATQEHGLAVPMGVVSATGVAGLTLGGGYGWLRNKYGLSCDNLVAASVVTADGRVVQASEHENVDLLWGLRGGGGNFGIVTEFVFRLHSVGPDVMFVLVFHDGRGDKMKKAIQFYREFTAQIPDEVSTMMVCGQVPPDSEHFPVELYNAPMVAYGAMYAGSVEDGQRALQPLLDFAEPLMNASGVMPYVEAQQAFDAEYPDGLHYYWKSLNLAHLNDDAIDTIIKHARQQVSPLSTIDLWHVGGAVKRGSADTSAFSGRQAAFMLGGEANWQHAEDDGANIAWIRGLITAMQPFSDGSLYLNFPGLQEEGEAMMRDSFGPQYERLIALKNTYDPNNLFRLNQNIRPEV
jgi:hypothetical protein